jgi:hypothetical protein
LSGRLVDVIHFAEERFMKASMTPITCAVAALCSAFVVVTGAYAEGDKTTYEQAKASAKASYETAQKQCDALAGNAKDICIAEAKAVRKKAESTAEANYKGTSKAQYNARVTAANADYDVAKERCDDKSGNEKDVCVKEAKALREKAKADAKASRDVNKAQNDAAEDKRTAEYKAAAERCDALSGDAKTTCVNDAKTRFKM